LDFYTQDAVCIRRAAGLCLKRLALSQRLRLLGVRVGNLCKVDALPPRNQVDEMKLL